MRVLWIINMVLPSVAKELGIKTSASGGWLVDYAKKLSEEEGIELAVMTYSNVKTNMDVTAAGIRNFIFAGGGKRLLFDSPKTVKDAENVINKFKPDIIHLHGTEYSMGKAMLKVNEKYNIPVVLTIQGILKRISEEYYGGIDIGDILKMITLKELTKLKTQVFAKMLFAKNAKREANVLKSVKYVTGRTTWDKATMLSINPALEYYRHNYNLREEFYSAEKWQSEKFKPHTIYVGASSYPLKGLHIVLKAVEIVKKEYPDVKVIVPGGGFKDGKPVNPNGYEKYLLREIKKRGLSDNIYFAGRKSASEVTEILKMVNVCVVASAMENASATLCEAMMIGTPCICSYRGGMTALLRDGESGFYYDFPEYGVLAEKIKQLFADISLCEKFSGNTKNDASVRHDREKNFSELIRIYKDIIGKETK